MADVSNWDDSLLKLFARVQNDADTAVDTAKALLGDGEVKRLPDKLVGELKDDLSDCRKGYDGFLKAMDADDPKKMDAAFNVFALRLTALQIRNEYISALADSAVASRGAEMLATLVEVTRDADRYIQDSRKRTEELRDKLKKAIKAVSYAKLQTALNVALSAALLALPEIEGIAAGRLAIASMAGHFGIDALLGPKAIDAPGAAVTVAGDIGDAIKTLREALTSTTKKLLGAAGMLTTLGMNAKELKEAKALVDELKEAVEKVRKAVDSMAEEMEAAFNKLPALERKLTAAIKDAQQARAKSRDAAEDYGAIRKEIARASR